MTEPIEFVNPYYVEQKSPLHLIKVKQNKDDVATEYSHAGYDLVVTLRPKVDKGNWYQKKDDSTGNVFFFTEKHIENWDTFGNSSFHDVYQRMNPPTPYTSEDAPTYTKWEQIKNLPLGTILKDNDGDQWERRSNGWYCDGIHTGNWEPEEFEPYTVVTVG